MHNGTQCGRPICSPITCFYPESGRVSETLLKVSFKKIKFFDESTPLSEHRSALDAEFGLLCCASATATNLSLAGHLSKPTESHNLRTITWFWEVLGTIASDLCWKDTFEETSSGRAAQKKRIIEQLFKTSYKSFVNKQHPDPASNYYPLQ